MILIADSGSTKASWCLIDKSGGEYIYFETEGYNPYYVNEDYIVISIQSNLNSSLITHAVKEIYFYGAGCSGTKRNDLRGALQRVWPRAAIYVESDLLGAARELLGTKTGFAAILGTGTNTCLYDGSNITYHIDSYGFILGDEGSGAAIGKKLLIDYVRGYLPENIEQKFLQMFSITPDDVLKRVYFQSLGNRYCASFARFVKDNLDETYVKSLVESVFRNFFKRLVCFYPNYTLYSFNCVGSVAFHFSEILLPIAEEYGMHPGRIEQVPIKQLAEYHIQKLV